MSRDVMNRDAMSPTAEYDAVSAQCQHLRLNRIAQILPAHLEQAAQQEQSYSAFLHALLAEEVAAKHAKHQAMRVQMARFPFQKTLDSFDWKAQPSIDPKVIKELATMRFVAHGANALLLGPPGLGTYYITSVCDGGFKS